ncbi:XAC0095 family protein [Coralloluteibacterium stylophorae]|uniref:XAC0095-like domain-containing protein n=1 Tax=Coralloluteibacterium stylophorae TaxID=1776034 RepID=A0A8J7VQW4_9GAMM|nr:hypothetical protein [Coralloluteibacterium stylophorae]MBS7457170.1 hypothetical protein [Coralloluteibacterium stylophorae]
MSNREPNEPNTMGYFLPEDSQFRLKKLREHMEFLSHLAQPRTADEGREWAPEVRMDELAVCLELLAEQAGLVLAEVSWMGSPQNEGYASESEREAASAGDEPGEAPDGVRFGMTLDQIDELARLVQTISAHGDAIAAGSDGLAPQTLPLLGEAIFDGAEAVRAILDQVEAQRIGPTSAPRGGVREERAVYGLTPEPSVRGTPRQLVARVDLAAMDAWRCGDHGGRAGMSRLRPPRGAVAVPVARYGAGPA